MLDSKFAAINDVPNLQIGDVARRPRAIAGTSATRGAREGAVRSVAAGIRHLEASSVQRLSEHDLTRLNLWA